MQRYPLIAPWHSMLNKLRVTRDGEATHDSRQEILLHVQLFAVRSNIAVCIFHHDRVFTLVLILFAIRQPRTLFKAQTILGLTPSILTPKALGVFPSCHLADWPTAGDECHSSSGRVHKPEKSQPLPPTWPNVLILTAWVDAKKRATRMIVDLSIFAKVDRMREVGWKEKRRNLIS